MYLNLLTFSQCPLRSFNKKLEHLLCLGLILVDVFWMKRSFSKLRIFIFLDIRQKHIQIFKKINETILRYPYNNEHLGLIASGLDEEAKKY